MKHSSHHATRGESSCNIQIWGHVLQFQQGLSSIIANCYAVAVSLICKSSWQHAEYFFANACRPRSLFVLSITILLFGFDIRFMTTSIHLLVSDDSVAHTAIMYSEGSRGKAAMERHTLLLTAPSSLMNRAAMDVFALSTHSLLPSGVINQRDFIVNAERETEVSSSHKTTLWWWDVTSPSWSQIH